MTNTAPRNVVLMTDYQKSRRPLSQSEISNVLEDCRDLALTRLTRTVSVMFDKLEDDFFKLAEEASGLDEQNAFINARKQARIKRTATEGAFKKQFVALFGEKVGRKSTQKAPADHLASPFLELSLVGDEEIEEDIAVTNMVNVLLDACDAELQALAFRFGFLLDLPELDQKNNPLGPDVIHNAFKTACKQLGSGFMVQMAMMKLFDRQLAEDLPAIYKEVNATLVSRQILPDIRPGYRAKPKPGSASRPSRPGQPISLPDDPQQLFSLLQQLLLKGSQQLTGVAPGPAHALTAGAQPGSAPAGFFDPTASAARGFVDPGITAATGFFNSLNRLQRGDHILIASLGSTVDAQAVAAGTGNFLHQIKATPFAQGLPQFDAITIDIVAMLFDYIFEDPKVPDAMKALIGRLQIPVLKVAMLDKRFFSSRAHPTRKLIDTIAAAAISRGYDISQADPLYKETERIVQRVVLEFESDVAIFSELLAHLEAFLATEEKRTEQTVEQSARIIHDRERVEIARVLAEDEVRQRVEAAPTVTTVREFLLQPWVHVLTSAHAAAGEEGAPWKEAIRAMDELLWSVKPKISAEERKQLVMLLPALLKRLHVGMATISMDEEQRKQFFANLVTCHTRAVKAGLGGESADSQDADPALAWTLPDQNPAPDQAPGDTLLDAVMEANEESTLVRTNLADGNVEIEEVTLAREAKPRPAGDESDHQWEEITASLKRGDWVDFLVEDGNWLRYKLSWVSPLKKIYLFTNISSQKALSISPQAMEMQLREGTAIILQDIPLIDRAVENMLETLQQQGE